jgi:type I restriction enzyme R subunit
LLDKLDGAGYGKDDLETLQKMVRAEGSDLFDVLAYVAFALKPMTREERVEETKTEILQDLDVKQKEFLEFVLRKYVENGVDELSEEKLPQLLTLKFHAITDAINTLGTVDQIRGLFLDFQKTMYSK